MYTLSKTEVGHLLPQRPAVSHKGNFGHLLCVCGSKTMPGAAFLCTKAALRSGAGLVTAAFPESMYNIMGAKLSEALLLPLEETQSGSLSANCIDTLCKDLDKYTAIVIGCGLSVNNDTKAVVEAVIKRSNVPVIIDADGINIVSQNIDILKEAHCPIIMTPHPKEMSRLISLPVDLISSDRAKWARDSAKQFSSYIVLKGSNTVVASPEEERVYVNSSGNSGLAKGGSGDVLSGIIGAFCAQGMTLQNACASAVYIHGHCADCVADRLSKTGMIATDVIDELAHVFGDFGK